MKKISLLIILLVLVSFVGGTVLAQEEKEAMIWDAEVLIELPAPGLMPGDFFYFLDEWAEAIEEFFTFDPEAKAILQTERALERIAEVNALLEIKGVDAPGLDVAEAKIQRNMARSAEILERQKARGIEVALLARRLERNFDVRRKMLESVFDLEGSRLGVQKKETRLAIREARAINDFEKLAGLRIALENIKAQKERLGVREDGLMAGLDIEEERIELKMEIAERDLDILEDDMENLFDEREGEKEKRFEQKERALWLQEEALELQLRQAVLAEDAALIGDIKGKLIDLENQEQVTEQEQETAEIVLGQEEKRKRGMVEMREKALEQIQDAREEIFDVREEMAEMIVDEIIIEAPIAVLELIEQAESKLTAAEQVFAEGNYSRAFGLAMAAEKLTIKAERILEEKEVFTIPCKIDRDCLGLICPMVIGQDTPQCGPEGICICGPRRDQRDPEERPESPEKLENLERPEMPE
ncbi:MAG: hypothetical protein KYQ20_02445 [Candidatus Nealsonbacteria bacterium]|nr:hypothetical protein [Candidatus Nealsonbacteria bacterium]